MPNRCTSRAHQLSAAGSLRMSEPLTLEAAMRIRNIWSYFAVQISGFNNSRRFAYLFPFTAVLLKVAPSRRNTEATPPGSHRSTNRRHAT
ncbi:hypothetical protein TNCV_3850211 [Trichonephila clavipes]|nr:hypothetical protein TNCV_3850211 [Trichonephila clavipes]